MIAKTCAVSASRYRRKGRVKRLTQPDLLIMGGRAATAEYLIPRRFQRRRPLDEIGDRIRNVETQPKPHFDRARHALQLRRKRLLVVIEKAAQFFFGFRHRSERHRQEIEFCVEGGEHPLRRGDVLAFGPHIVQRTFAHDRRTASSASNR